MTFPPCFLVKRRIDHRGNRRGLLLEVMEARRMLAVITVNIDRDVVDSGDDLHGSRYLSGIDGIAIARWLQLRLDHGVSRCLFLYRRNALEPEML